MTKKIKIVDCCWISGIGFGPERLDNLLYRHLDRDRFELVVAYLQERPKPDSFHFEIPGKAIFAGSENHYEWLLKVFSSADIVQFKGGFAPMICEAAWAADAPALVEVMHITEPGQMFSNIDMTVCISETVRQTQIDMEKTEVIYNGIDLDKFPFRGETKKSDDKIIILQASHRAKQRFHIDEMAEELLSIDPRIELHLAGINQVGESSDRIKYFGLTDKIAELYREADILVMFSQSEAFGLVVVEAMASGCVPLVFDDMGPGEIVEHGVTGWKCGANDITVAQEMIKKAVAMRDSPDWESMRKAARHSVETKYSGEDCIRNYERLYLKLMEKKGREEPRVIENSGPIPEVYLDECISYFHAKRWDLIPASARNMVTCKEPFTVQRCASAAIIFAKQLASKQMGQLADQVYRKVNNSGMMTVEWLVEWLQTSDDPAINLMLIEELQNRGLADPAMIMLAAERLLAAGEVRQVLEILRKGVRSHPQSSQLYETVSLLEKKLGIDNG